MGMLFNIHGWLISSKQAFMSASCFLQLKIDPPLQPKIDPPYKKNKA